MHPDLLNNPTFLRYYSRWQANPSSAAFVGVADFFREYRLYDDALRVCQAGLQQNPELVSGRLVLARIYLELRQPAEAAVQLQLILDRMPEHPEAERLFRQTGVEPRPRGPASTIPAVSTTASSQPDPSVYPPLPSWATLTMARLYQRQGHIDQAAHIYRRILDREPGNREAQEGLQSLTQGVAVTPPK